MTCNFLTSLFFIFHVFIANVAELCVKNDLKFQLLVENYLLRNYKHIFSLLNGRLTYDSQYGLMQQIGNKKVHLVFT